MKTWIGCLLGAMALLLFSCQPEKKTEEVAVDLPQILEKKELVVLTVNSSVSYFNYRGEPWDSSTNWPSSLPSRSA